MSNTNFVDLTGQTIGGLYVVSRGPDYLPSGNARWFCKCLNCGHIGLRIGNLLKLKHSMFCIKCKNTLFNKSRMKPEFECLYNCLVKSARKKDYDCDITYEQFLEYTKIDKCHYCEIPIKWISNIHDKHQIVRYNLDRKNNDVGYTKDNCVVCCKECNMIKSDKLSYKVMIKLGQFLKEERTENAI